MISLRRYFRFLVLVRFRNDCSCSTQTSKTTFQADLAASIANNQALVAQGPSVDRDPLRVALEAQRETLKRLEQDEQLVQDGEQLLEDDIPRVASALGVYSEATDVVRVAAMADSFTLVGKARR